MILIMLNEILYTWFIFNEIFLNKAHYNIMIVHFPNLNVYILLSSIINADLHDQI